MFYRGYVDWAEIAAIKGPLPLGPPFAFSPDGELLAAGLYSSLRFGPALQGVMVTEIATGKRLLEISGNERFVAFSPDSRMFATATEDEGIRVWELSTGKPICHLPWPGAHLPYPGGRVPLFALAFMPSGRALATGMDGTILIWDLSPAAWPPHDLPNHQQDNGLERLWANLADPDAGKAYRASFRLWAKPAQAISLLAERLFQPSSGPDLSRVPQWIADLDNNSSAVRATAAKELAKLGQLVEPSLRQALRMNPTAERGARLESLLEPLHGLPPRKTMRAIRAIQVLEWIGSGEARQLLAKLAQGKPETRATQEAKASLERLAKRINPSH